MKKIPEKFDKYGMTFELIERNENKAIYSQYLPLIKKIIGYEIIKIRLAGDNNKYYDKGDEIYPGSSTWGNSAWTEKTIEAAYNKYDQI